tara:strand:- start:10 stop:576 length:567 start_codon:yes stop_codon:yes gene_type:complete
MKPDQRMIFYKGKYVDLKVLDESDIYESNWVGWFNDEKLCMQNGHHYFPNTVQKQKELLNSLNYDKKLQLGILDKDNPNKICGVISLQDIDLINRKAEIACLSENSATSSKPQIYLESHSLIFKHGFNQLGLNKIYGGTINKNIPGALKRAFNFEIEGVLKKSIFKNGVFYDATLFAVFSDTIIYPQI